MSSYETCPGAYSLCGVCRAKVQSDNQVCGSKLCRYVISERARYRSDLMNARTLLCESLVRSAVYEVAVSMIHGVEKWSVIPGNPGCRISTFGRFSGLRLNGWSRDNSTWGRVLRDGYRHIRLGGGRMLMVGHLVADVFLGPKPLSCECLRHLNDLCWDNRLDNIRWGTRQENSQDSVRNGRIHLRCQSKISQTKKEFEILHSMVNALLENER